MTTSTRTITVPENFIFNRGRGDTRQVTLYPTEKMSDDALLSLLAYGQRLLNDTVNGAKKDAWAGLAGERLVETFLAWLASERGQRAPALVIGNASAAMAVVIKQYLDTRRALPAWKAAEVKADLKGKALPKTLDGLQTYLAKLNGLPAFPQDKWASIEADLKAKEQALLAEAESVKEDELLS